MRHLKKKERSEYEGFQKRDPFKKSGSVTTVSTYSLVFYCC